MEYTADSGTGSVPSNRGDWSRSRLEKRNAGEAAKLLALAQKSLSGYLLGSGRDDLAGRSGNFGMSLLIK